MKKFTKIALMGAMGLLFVGCSSSPEDVASVLHADITRDAKTGIVKDSSTGLEWQDNEVGETKTLENAINTCENLTLGSYSDWRLPNEDELMSIVDKSHILKIPTIKNGFENTVSKSYWSSTTFESNDTADHLNNRVGTASVGFYYGSSSMNKSTSKFFVRCVRGAGK